MRSQGLSNAHRCEAHLTPGAHILEARVGMLNKAGPRPHTAHSRGPGPHPANPAPKLCSKGQTCVRQQEDVVENPTCIIENVSFFLEILFQTTFHLQGA